MAKRKKPEPKTKTYAVPYEVTFRGDLFVEATSADEARDIADSGNCDDDTFGSRASIADWEVLGEPKEL